MPTVSRDLPDRPHLDVPKRLARELLKEFRAGVPAAIERVRMRHPKFKHTGEKLPAPEQFRLSDAQLVIAREYALSNWTQLKDRFLASEPARLLWIAIRADDRDEVARLLREHPKLLHIPLWSGNWGPPMSHAANIGRLEIIKLLAGMGARDFQHAFDRALLQGQLECARWLHERGAKLLPGIIMGACETLNANGLQFLAELRAPFTDGDGDPLAPVALVLGTYSRDPEGKHEVLKIFQRQGYQFPDTPMMAFHRGDAQRLRQFLERDPKLVERRFSLSEIYPRELGCSAENPGMCGTPIEGNTLLQLAIDFDEQEIFDLLLAAGADVNARAALDKDGFGGHTPLFNAVISCASICGRQKDAAMSRELLERGALPETRATVRKFLDWQETPCWHEARDVTALEWAETFPHQNWVNPEAVRLLQLRKKPGSAEVL
jgi:hypothetical protein